MNEITKLQISVLFVRFEARFSSFIALSLFAKKNDPLTNTRTVMMIEMAYNGTRNLSATNLYILIKINAFTRETSGVMESEFSSKSADSNMARHLRTFARWPLAGSCHS